jgi:hypothetical protein
VSTGCRSRRVTEILWRAKALTGDSATSSRRVGREAAVAHGFPDGLRRTKLDITAHGSRSAFRDWAAERTNFPTEVAEGALAHTIRSGSTRSTGAATYWRNGGK